MKLSLTFLILTVCGLFIVFFQGLGIQSTPWVKLCLRFLPLFLSGMILMSLGVILIRAYYNEVKQREVNLKRILLSSWGAMVAPIGFIVPLLLSYLILWLILGIFVLLYEIPLMGAFFEIIFSFGPFVVQLASILLCTILLVGLFYVTPMIALKGMHGSVVYPHFFKRLHTDMFSHLFLLFIGIIPLLITLGILSFAVYLSGLFYSSTAHPMYSIVQNFFIMIPFSAVLTVPVVFFFNFSAESHALLHKVAARSKGALKTA
jgi:hypothetical protein